METALIVCCFANVEYRDTVILFVHWYLLLKENSPACICRSSALNAYVMGAITGNLK